MYWVKQSHLCQFYVHPWHFRASALWNWETLCHWYMFLLQKEIGASLYMMNLAVLPSCLDSTLAASSPAAGGDAVSHQLWLCSPLLPHNTGSNALVSRSPENSAEEPHLQVLIYHPPLPCLNTAREYTPSLYTDCPYFTTDSWRNSWQESCIPFINM